MIRQYAGPIAATIGAIVLSAATMVFIVSSQASAGNSPNTENGTVTEQANDYGTNTQFAGN